MESSTEKAAVTPEQGEPRSASLKRLSRRALLGLGALGAAGRAEAQVRNPQRSQPVRMVDAELKLLRRVTNGATGEDISWIRSLGYHGYLEWQLAAETMGDPEAEARCQAFTTLPLPPSTLYTLDSALVTREIAEATITRGIYSNRQLYERTVEFWSDHFHTNINTVGIHKTFEDRDAIRKNAFGTFFQLLGASASSPAMLNYLNNTASTRTAPNQNYAREVLELHTLGVDGGYTQQDVQEVARCFTGWRVMGNTGDGRAGLFYFDANRHDNNSKTVLGVPFAAGGGINDGINVINILSTHPATARFVARKMLRWFLDYDPSTTLINDIAGEFLRSQGNVKAMVRRILSYDNVLWAPPLFKRPFHYIASALRVLNANVTNYGTLRNTYLSGTGHAPFAWGPPNGYPHAFEYWGGLPLPRWNFAFNLANNSISGVTVDLAALLMGATTAVQVADRIDTVVFGGEMPSADKAALITYLRPDPPSQTRIRDAFGLAIASPSFQWY
jgi:uncharacterized protein (DUF1800 family)